MKKDIRKRLGIYSMTAGAMALGVEEGKAQIVYNDFTDIAITSTGGAADSIDMNGDGLNDFYVKYMAGSANLLYVYPKADNSFITNDANHHVIQMNANDPITATSGAGMLWWSTSAIMNNTGGIDKYIGLQVKKGGSFYYGWVRLNVQNNNIVIKDAAYNSIAGGSILAGQTVTAGVIAPEVANNTIIFVNSNKEVCVRRENQALSETGTVDVISLSGKLVGSAPLNGSETLIPVSSDVNELYIVRVSYTSGAVSKKTSLR